jgi:hypothetical protein
MTGIVGGGWNYMPERRFHGEIFFSRGMNGTAAVGDGGVFLSGSSWWALRMYEEGPL